jgi:hypothetical protein
VRSPTLRRILLGGIALVGMVCPAFSADSAVRVLFVTSRDPGVDVHVSRLEQAVSESHGPLAIAETLSDAHVVVQFTDYRRTVGEKGEPLFRWVGQARLLTLPEGRTRTDKPLPERFELLVIGDRGNQELRALELLEKMVSKALRPKTVRPEREGI